MGVEATRNSFRAAVLHGIKPELIVTEKSPLQEGGGDALDGVKVPRLETRRGDHRGGDRHRLSGEQATAVHEGTGYAVEVVNLSAGGAMIRCKFAPKLWDLVELQLGEGPGLEGAVRWIKDGCIGLEFAHETKIDCDPDQRASLLLEVIQRSFPDQEVRLDGPECDAGPLQDEEEELGGREEKRHPLIWKGEVHFACDSNPVRLRNVSPGGALVDIAVDYPLDAEVLLDLGGAGQYFATVQWICGDQAGLKFVRPFDIGCLAKAKPEVVSSHGWKLPDFLQANGEDAGWDDNWSRSSISEIRSSLEGYLKR